MTPETLLELSALPQFPRTAAELMRIAGLHAAARLIGAWRGQEFPVPLHRRRTAPSERRYAQLAEIVGEAVAGRIVAHWGGQILYVPNCKEALTARNHDRIRAEFDRLTVIQGYSQPEAVFELGLFYDLTGKEIQNVLKQPDNEVRAVGQRSLF